MKKRKRNKLIKKKGRGKRRKKEKEKKRDKSLKKGKDMYRKGGRKSCLIKKRFLFC